MLDSQEKIYKARALIRDASPSLEAANEQFELFVAVCAALSLPMTLTDTVADFADKHRQITKYISDVRQYVEMDLEEVRHIAVQVYEYRMAVCLGKPVEVFATLLGALQNTQGDLVGKNARDTLAQNANHKQLNEAFSLAARIAL